MNNYTDGGTENKGIVQDPVNIRQVVDEARTQMEAYSYAMHSEPEELLLEAHEKDFEQSRGVGLAEFER